MQLYAIIISQMSTLEVKNTSASDNRSNTTCIDCKTKAWFSSTQVCVGMQKVATLIETRNGVSRNKVAKPPGHSTAPCLGCQTSNPVI